MVHSNTRCAGMGWDGLCVVMLCFFMYINIHMYKMAEDEDDDALMLAATYCKLMHIHLY